MREGGQIDPAESNRALPDVAEFRRERQNLRVDPAVSEAPGERSVLAEHDVDVHVPRESGEETQQRNLAAGQPCHVIDEDHAESPLECHMTSSLG